jgi:hypothetical protein
MYKIFKKNKKQNIGRKVVLEDVGGRCHYCMIFMLRVRVGGE